MEDAIDAEKEATNKGIVKENLIGAAQDLHILVEGLVLQDLDLDQDQKEESIEEVQEEREEEEAILEASAAKAQEAQVEKVMIKAEVDLLKKTQDLHLDQNQKRREKYLEVKARA